MMLIAEYLFPFLREARDGRTELFDRTGREMGVWTLLREALYIYINNYMHIHQLSSRCLLSSYKLDGENRHLNLPFSRKIIKPNKPLFVVLLLFGKYACSSFSHVSY